MSFLLPISPLNNEPTTMTIRERPPCCQYGGISDDMTHRQQTADSMWNGWRDSPEYAGDVDFACRARNLALVSVVQSDVMKCRLLEKVYMP